jgi:HAD superfamily hydrolase (TIGR01459 family)
MTKEIQSILEIQAQYDVFFVDMVGVIYDGLNPYPEAIEAINTLLKAQKILVFVSNNPRPSTLARAKLEKFGLEGNFQVITSGDFMRHKMGRELSEITFYHLGDKRNKDLLSGLAVKTVPSLEGADGVILSGFLEEHEDETSLNDELRSIFESGKPIYCPNPDRLALYGSQLRRTAGFLADKIREWGGTVLDIGKPSLEFFVQASQLVPLPVLDKKRILMVGDTLETDIQGATNFGIDSLFVLGGISGTHGKLNNKPWTALRDMPYHPTYVMSSLR